MRLLIFIFQMRQVEETQRTYLVKPFDLLFITNAFWAHPWIIITFPFRSSVEKGATNRIVSRSAREDMMSRPVSVSALLGWNVFRPLRANSSE